MGRKGVGEGTANGVKAGKGVGGRQEISQLKIKGRRNAAFRTGLIILQPYLPSDHQMDK